MLYPDNIIRQSLFVKVNINCINSVKQWQCLIILDGSSLWFLCLLAEVLVNLSLSKDN